MTQKQRRGLECLQNLPKDLDKLEYQEVCIDLNSYFDSVPVMIYETDKIDRFKETHPRDASIIYRARENETIIPNKSTIELPFKTLDEISIIPDNKKHLIKKFGRCNKPFEPRFYASNNYPTASFEAVTKGFTKGVSQSAGITVGQWKIIEPLVIAQINYSEKFIDLFTKHDEERYTKMIEYTKRLNEHTRKQIIAEDAFDPEFVMQLFDIFSSEFAKIEIRDHYDYMLSNYYCDHIFERIKHQITGKQVDAILYPSVAYSYQEHNIVLHPRAMSKLKFLNAMFVWMQHHGKDETTQFIPLEQNVKADIAGNLQWKNFNW